MRFLNITQVYAGSNNMFLMMWKTIWSNWDWFNEPCPLHYKQSCFPQLSPVSVTVCILPHPLSFQKEFSFDEKDDPAKSTKDIDVSLLANLPKGE